jgi:D-arabinose 1-dehydrogenase-like Zn-dependent alcohol dehydrogenase
VTVISSSASKAAQAKAIGADDVVGVYGQEGHSSSCQVPGPHSQLRAGLSQLRGYHPLLKRRGYQIILGLQKGFLSALAVDALTGGRSRVKNSMIGGVANTQAIVDLCAKHKIKIFPHVKVVPARAVPVYELNDIFSKLFSNNDEGIRYMSDTGNTLEEEAVAKCDAPPPKLKKYEGAIEIPAEVRETSWLLFTGKWL